VPVIDPPAGSSGLPVRGIRLTDDLPDELIALIRVEAVRQDDQDFSIIDATGHAKIPHPVFEVRVKNRSTIRAYMNNQTGVPVSVESGPLPLTYFGNAAAGRKPTDNLVTVTRNETGYPRWCRRSSSDNLIFHY